MEKLLARIKALHKKTHFKSVLSLTKRLLSVEKDNEAALFYHAYALHQTGRFRRSLQYWQRLKKINPRQMNLHLNIGVCHADLRNFKEANRNYKIELKLDPFCIKAIYNLGINHYYAHKYKLATPWLERCHSQKYAVDEIICKLAWCYFKTGQADKEQSLYEAYLLAKPNDTWALNNLGSHLISKGAYHRILLRLKKAERLDPGYQRVKQNIRKAERLLKKLKAQG